jgi:hypothetical protein
MFAENLFQPSLLPTPFRCTWTIVEDQGAKISFTIIPHYIILYIIQKPTNFCFPERRRKSPPKRDERKFAAMAFLPLFFPRKREEGKGKRRKGEKSNQNCMWFVISLVFVKVTNSISAWETGKPKRKAKGNFLLTSFSFGSMSLDENKSPNSLASRPPFLPRNC